MKVLRVFDMLPFIHAGAVNKRAYLLPELRDTEDSFVESIIYCGGVSLMWNILYQHYGTCDMVFCSDRTPTVKQEMFSGYKANREHKESVRQMRDTAEYILNDCGFDVLYEDGYEADDFIFSVVQENKNAYDHIYIYTGDSDLYFLVSDNVTILPSSSRAKEVNMQNYTYTAGGSKREYVPYNMNTFYKILYGDTSDGIPPLPKNIAEHLRSAFDNKMMQRFMGDKETILQALEISGPEVMAQAHLVLPIDVRAPREFKRGNKVRIAEWGSAFGNKYYATGGEPPKRIKDCIEEMAELGFAVTR